MTAPASLKYALLALGIVLGGLASWFLPPQPEAPMVISGPFGGLDLGGGATEPPDDTVERLLGSLAGAAVGGIGLFTFGLLWERDRRRSATAAK